MGCCLPRANETDVRLLEHLLNNVDDVSSHSNLIFTARIPPAIEISTDLFASNKYILPSGRRSSAAEAPLRIWSKTGILGDV
jgi:hypothetical protein